MTPSDVRSLIAICGFSNREAAEALGAADDRIIRRYKSGDETPPPAVEQKLIEIAAQALAAQMMRAVNLAAGGQVDFARLHIRENQISVDTHLSAPVADRVRKAVLAELAKTGLTIERVN